MTRIKLNQHNFYSLQSLIFVWAEARDIDLKD